MPRVHLKTWVPYVTLVFIFLSVYNWRLLGLNDATTMCQCAENASLTQAANVVDDVGALLKEVAGAGNVDESPIGAASDLIVDDGKAVVALPACAHPTINMVYLKLHKCASDTMVNVLHRFGLKRNLTFVLPVRGRMTLGFPYVMENHFFRPLKTKQFNILCQHVIYTPSVMSRIMPADSVYFTSIREPFARMKSAYRFFNLQARAELLSGPNQLERYLEDIPRIERALRSPANYKHRTSCIPIGYSFTYNGMAFGLGFDTGFHRDTVDQSHNATYIREWIAALDRQFSLVMVVEYFHESLVLLRRLMCWTMEDILYVKRNANEYEEKDKHIEPRLVENFRRHNVPDYVLYYHYNRTLWRKIAAAGDGFWPEVRHFDGVIDSIARFCQAPIANATLLIPKSQWNDAVTLHGWYCEKMSKRIYDDLTDIYEAMPGQVIKKPPYVPGC